MKKDRKARLTEGPINKTLIQMTIPMVFGLFGMVAFNLVDSFFIGQLGDGKIELAALGFTFPVVLILGAIGMGVSMGASAVISRAIGEGDRDKVQRLTVDSLMLAVIFAGVFVILGLLTMDPVFRLLGANPDSTLPLVKEYMEVWYLGVIFVIVPFVGNSAIRADGDTLTPALIMTSMVGLNILLDWLLIFGIGPFPALGLKGAALATLIARACSLVMGLIVLIRRDMLTFIFPSVDRIWESWKSILHIGLPASATNLVVPLTTALITNLVAQFGEAAVAALVVSARIDLFAIMVVVALSSVLGPFVGQNLGAGNINRLQTGIQTSQRFGLVWGLVMLVVLGLAAPWVAPIFSKDPQVIEHIILYLHIVPFGYAARCIYALDNTILNVLNKPLTASLVTIGQMLGIYLPFAYLGANLWGLQGVFMAIPLTFLFGGTASYFLVRQHVARLVSRKTALADSL